MTKPKLGTLQKEKKKKPIEKSVIRSKQLKKDASGLSSVSAEPGNRLSTLRPFLLWLLS